MRRTLLISLIVLAVVSMFLYAPTGRGLAQSDAPPTSTSGSLDGFGGIGRAIQSMIDWLFTPRTPPTAFADIYADIPHARLADGGFVLGRADAPITIIEFGDPACPHCQDYKPVIDQFIDQYVRPGRAALELRILPTTGGQQSAIAAQYAECADAQRSGAFWSVYELLYELAENGRYYSNMGPVIADRLRLDGPALEACVGNATQVMNDYQLASQLGVTGTPAILVRRGDRTPVFITLDGQTYNLGGVPFDVLRRVIDGDSQVM